MRVFKKIWNNIKFWRYLSIILMILLFLISVAFIQAIRLLVELYGMIP